MIEIKLVKHREKRKELLDLFRVSFGHNILAELWDWKYLQNPLASTDPEIIVAADNGKTVGARPLLLSEMWLGDERVKAAQPCDTMVHPEYRRKGIFSRMNQFAIQYFKQNGYAFFYNFPGPMARPGYLEQGWKVVSPTENLFQVFNPRRLASYELKNRFLGSVAGFLYDKFSNTRLKRLSSFSSILRIEVFDQFTDELKATDALRAKSGIDLVRSENYLRWRFDQHPKHSYKYVMAKKNDKLWGYAVVSTQNWLNGLMCGMIVDYLVKDKDVDCFRELITGCLWELQKSECDFISIWAFTNAGLRKELMKRLQFKSSARFPYSRFWGGGYFVARKLEEQIARKIDLYNKESWRVTYAYPDTT